MARPRTFDPEQALDQAVLLFWRKGYFDASVDDLVRAMRINRHSLYALHGGKRGLFLESLKRYWWTVHGDIVNCLLCSGAALPEIREYFQNLLRHFQTPQGRYGCLFWNAAADLAARDPEVAGMVREAADFLAARFELALANARRSGQISGRRDIRKSAHALTAVAQGMAVQARCGIAGEVLGDCAELAAAGAGPGGFSEILFG